MTEKQDKMTRRGWLGWLGRGAAAVGLGALGVKLLSGRPSTQEPENCTRKKVCRGCPWVADCGRPEAMSYRAAQERSHE